MILRYVNIVCFCFQGSLGDTQFANKNIATQREKKMFFNLTKKYFGDQTGLPGSGSNGCSLTHWKLNILIEMLL